jgi:hypothetical protein
VTPLLAFAIALCLIWLAFGWFCFLLTRTGAPARRARTRSRRRGGYIKPHASPIRSRGTTLTRSDQETTGSSSSPYPPGGLSEDWVGRRLLRDPSRLTGRGWSTVGTEGAGGNGQQPNSADSPDGEWTRLPWQTDVFVRPGACDVHGRPYFNPDGTFSVVAPRRPRVGGLSVYAPQWRQRNVEASPKGSARSDPGSGGGF